MIKRMKTGVAAPAYSSSWHVHAYVRIYEYVELYTCSSTPHIIMTDACTEIKLVYIYDRRAQVLPGKTMPVIWNPLGKLPFSPQILSSLNAQRAPISL